MDSSNPDSYDDVYPLIRTGDIVFVGGAKSIIGWLITKVTGSSFSHVGIAVWMYDDKGQLPTLYIVEAYSPGRRLVALRHYGESRPLAIVCSPVDWSLYRSSVLGNTGSVVYGYLDLITIAIREKFGIRLKDFRGEVCSEMVAKALNTTNRFNLETSISPGSLYMNLLALGHKVRSFTLPKRVNTK